MASFVVQNACFSLNTRFWQCLILIQQASALPRICTRICAGLVAIVSLRTALGSLKEEERRRRNNLRGRRFRFTTLETSVSRAKGIFKLRKIIRLIIPIWLKFR